MAKYQLKCFNDGMHYFILNDRLANKFLSNGHKRVICIIGDIEIHCAIMRRKEGYYFVMLGSAILKKLSLKEHDFFSARFQVDTTKHQFSMPDELQEVLNTDHQADRIFQSLSPGNQRGLIYLISQVKSIDKRIERSLKMADQLKNGITSPRIILK